LCSVVTTMFKLGAITDEVSQDFERVVEVAGEYGLTALEPRSVWEKTPQELTDEDCRKIKQLADDAGLEICCIASPFLKCDLGDEGQYNTHLDYFRRFVQMAHMWDCQIIRGFTFWKTGPARDVWQQIIDAYEEPLRICEQEDVYIGIENEASTHIATAREAARLYEDINHPRLRAIWDPANEVSAEEGERPFPEAWERMKPWLIHVHIKDSVKDPEGPREARCVPVGEGIIDYAGQFQALIDMGYDGVCSLETHWRPTTELDADLLNEPGGADFSSGAEIASRICLENINNILRDIGAR